MLPERFQIVRVDIPARRAATIDRRERCVDEIGEESFLRVLPENVEKDV